MNRYLYFTILIGLTLGSCVSKRKFSDLNLKYQALYWEHHELSKAFIETRDRSDSVYYAYKTLEESADSLQKWWQKDINSFRKYVHSTDSMQTILKYKITQDSLERLVFQKNLRSKMEESQSYFRLMEDLKTKNTQLNSSLSQVKEQLDRETKSTKSLYNKLDSISRSGGGAAFLESGSVLLLENSILYFNENDPYLLQTGKARLENLYQEIKPSQWKECSIYITHSNALVAQKRAAALDEWFHQKFPNKKVSFGWRISQPNEEHPLMIRWIAE